MPELEALSGWNGGTMASHYTKITNRKHRAKQVSEKINNAHAPAFFRSPYPEKCRMIYNDLGYKKSSWCGREDSNFHELPHSDLNAARLPIPPRPHAPKGRLVIRLAPCSK
jgi:hypothetical protein